ncbi:MAG: CdaR family protein [Treponema sp.]|nr:CdaR family protein [Treponema sp.]
MNVRTLLVKAAANWPAKVISIALAMMLFIFHRMSSLSERFFTVPLVMESQTNLVPSNSYPRTIRITLRGDANSILTIQEDDIQAYVDLSRYNAPGNYQAVVQVRKKGVAQDISPLEIGIDPADISLSLDHKISKLVPLKANIQGQVDQGYVLNSYSLNPTQVIIDGPSSLIGFISELNTDVVDLNGRSADFSVSVNILNQDPLLVLRGNGVTEFQGFISRIITVRNIQYVPVNITGLDEKFSAEVDSKYVSVHLEGRNQEDLDNFVIPDDFLRVDCSAILEPGTYMLQIDGTVPSSITMTTDPQELMVRILPAQSP